MTIKNYWIGYSICYSTIARKSLERMDKRVARRIHMKLLQLVEGAENLDLIKLECYSGYRLRCGSYRVVFEVINRELVIHVVNVDHRKDSYRNL